MTEITLIIGSYIRNHIQEVSFGITAVTLALVAPIINGTLKQVSKNFHWLLRFIAFIILITVGYGFLSQVLYHGIRHWFHGLDNFYLILWITVIYLILAWFAIQQKKI